MKFGELQVNDIFKYDNSIFRKTPYYYHGGSLEFFSNSDILQWDIKVTKEEKTNTYFPSNCEVEKIGTYEGDIREKYDRITKIASLD